MEKLQRHSLQEKNSIKLPWTSGLLVLADLVLLLYSTLSKSIFFFFFQKSILFLDFFPLNHSLSSGLGIVRPWCLSRTSACHGRVKYVKQGNEQGAEAPGKIG